MTAAEQKTWLDAFDRIAAKVTDLETDAWKDLRARLTPQVIVGCLAEICRLARTGNQFAIIGWDGMHHALNSALPRPENPQDQCWLYAPDANGTAIVASVYDRAAESHVPGWSLTATEIDGFTTDHPAIKPSSPIDVCAEVILQKVANDMHEALSSTPADYAFTA